ncbi:MAG TPA: hypothetical protein VJ796_09505 [Acidimicrobiia bacterium]|nr:hypothetical protein [Acidimicrobiia bacterium]
MLGELLLGLLLGLVGLPVAALIRRADWGALFVALALAGVWLFTPRWIDSPPPFPLPLVVAAIVVATVAVALLFRSGGHVAPWPFLIALGGAWATVPDTESISVLLGAALPLAFAAVPLGYTPIGPFGGGAAGLLSAVVALSEAGSRSAAAVGAIGALTMTAFWRNDRLSWLAHLALVGFWSRVAGRTSSGPQALVWGLAGTAVILGARALWRYSLRRRNPERFR